MFGIQRTFKHSSADRVLKIGDIKEFKVGIVIGEWEIYGFSKPLYLCLSEKGDRRKCGRETEFKLKPPVVKPTVEPNAPSKPTDVK